MWRADIAAPVVAVDRAPSDLAGARPLELPCLPAAGHLTGTGRHLVLDAGGTRHRLWLRHVETGVPVMILLAPSPDPVRAAAADAARRLLAGLPMPPMTALKPTRFQRGRLTLLLTILDADLGGASNREIGTGLIFPRLRGTDAATWKASAERRRAQRLIAEARRMMRGEYRTLLSRASSAPGAAISPPPF